ncbi:MAG: hypothetical protein WCT13_01255 [Patescibacteria group bacterium]
MGLPLQQYVCTERVLVDRPMLAGPAAEGAEAPERFLVRNLNLLAGLLVQSKLVVAHAGRTDMTVLKPLLFRAVRTLFRSVVRLRPVGGQEKVPSILVRVVGQEVPVPEVVEEPGRGQDDQGADDLIQGVLLSRESMPGSFKLPTS